MEKKTVLGIGLLFTGISGGLGLIGRILGFFATELPFFMKSTPAGAGYWVGENIGSFIYRSGLWLLVTAAILLILMLSYRKITPHVCLDIMKDRLICQAAGVLLLLQGSMELASVIPSRGAILQAGFASAAIMQDKARDILLSNTVSGAVVVLVLLCQLGLGIWLWRKNKKDGMLTKSS